MQDTEIIERDARLHEEVLALQREFHAYMQRHMDLHIKQTAQTVGTWLVAISLTLMVVFEVLQIV